VSKSEIHHLKMWRTLLICLFSTFLTVSRSELWEKELGKEVYIEASVEGLDSVQLECKDSKMIVTINLEEDGFEGVIYTRGSYKMGKPPCFYDAQGFLVKVFNLEWDLKECLTKTDENGLFTNVVLVQQDDWLIFPGDMAFEVTCSAENEATIGLADPDPGAKSLPDDKRQAVSSSSGSVTWPSAAKSVTNNNKKSSDEL
jgi:hypothetical protein